MQIDMVKYCFPTLHYKNNNPMSHHHTFTTVSISLFLGKAFGFRFSLSEIQI